MHKLIALFTLTCGLGAALYPQSKSPKMQHAIDAYAFLCGQEQSLVKIAAEFPKLDSDIEKITSSAIMFNRAKANIELYLKANLTTDEFQRLETEIMISVETAFKKPIEREAYAQNYLEEVKQRIKGAMEIPMCRTILSFAYEEFPEKEMTDGYIITYNTAGHQKSKNADLKIEIPKSWETSDAEQAETVHEFTSCAGYGSEKILIMIHEVPETNEDMFSDADIREMVPAGTKLFRIEHMTIAGTKGAMAETEETFQGKQGQLKVRMLHFMFAKRGKLYCIQGSVGPVPEQVDLMPRLQKYEPLFRRVIASVQTGA
jgi:hypothetical protein